MNKKAQSSLTKTIVSLIVSLVLIGSILSGCTSSYRAAKQQSEKVQDKSYLLTDINVGLTNLASGNGQAIPNTAVKNLKDWLPALTQSTYLKTSKDFYLLHKGEFILFFSGGQKDIILTYEKDDTKNITFKRPQINECYDRACICYVKNLNLWYVDSSSNELQVKLYLDKIEKGIDLGNDIKCVSAPNRNTLFLSPFGHIKEFIRPTDNNKNQIQLILPIPVVTTIYFNLLNEQDKQTYFFKQFNPYVINTNIQNNHSGYLKWTNGFIISEFLSSNKYTINELTENYIFSNYPLHLFKLNGSSLKYPEYYNNVISVIIDHNYPPITTTQVEYLNKQYEINLLKEKNPFRPNVNKYGGCPDCSEVKAMISSLTTNAETTLEAKTNIKLYFLDVLETLFLKSELNDQLNLKFIKSGEKTNMLFLIKDSANPFSVDSDVSFIFPNEINEFCFENIDEWTGELSECSSKDKYYVQVEDDGSIYFNKSVES